MTARTLTLDWKPIKALSHLASEKDLRKWCMGVWIDTSAPTLHVVATNGAVLGVYRTEEPSTQVPPVFIPLHIVQAAKGFDYQVKVRIDADGRARLENLGTRHYWQDEGFALIDWRRVFPKRCTGIAQHFDLVETARFLKVRKDLGVKAETGGAGGVYIAHNGKAEGPDGALVTLPGVPEFVGVAMALREPKDGSPLALCAIVAASLLGVLVALAVRVWQ